MVSPFDTKRRFKRCMVIILILSVSFFVLISCGIPSFFFIHEGTLGSSSSYYNFTDGDANSTYIDTYKMEFQIDIGGQTNLNVSSIEGPSLVYLYTIIPDDSQTYDSKDISEKFKREFSKVYINKNNGRPISSSTNEVMSIQYNNKTFKMNKFLICNGNDLINSQSPTEYGLKLSSFTKLQLYKSSFGFKYNSVAGENNFDIVLDQTDTSNHFKTVDGNLSDNISLRMKDRNKFLKQSDGNTEKYPLIETGSGYRILVFSAINVSNGSGFTNIFWGSLNEVGIIPSSGIN